MMRRAVFLLAALAFGSALAADEGKAIYDGTCIACHGTGVLGAPKMGDAAAWKARATGGLPGLVASAKAGKGAMPPKGGTTASEGEIKAVVTYMANASK